MPATTRLYSFFAALAFLLVIATPLHAQITVSQTTGCAPLVDVLFGGPNGASGILWDFGDGSSSNLADPTHTYANPGTYNIVYTATVGGSPVNETAVIEVYGKPLADFIATTPTAGCLPLVVTFEDASTGWNGVPITNLEWSFGDGGIDLNNSPTSYTYSLAGVFDVSLLVVDANGCDTTVVMPGMVSTSNPPTIALATNPSPAASCVAPLDVTFTTTGTSSNAPAGPGLTYSWDFGNGQTNGTAAPPAITYTDDTTYFSVLTVTDVNGCADSVTTPVSIGNPTAELVLTNGTNDTICNNAIFDNLSSSGSYSIDYGDGQSGLALTHMYPVPGNFVATIIVNAGGCADTGTVNVITEEIIADFTTTPFNGCNGVVTRQLTDASTNAVAWSWIAPGWTDSVQNPTQSLALTPPNVNEYVEPQLNIAGTSLLAFSEHGCADTKVWVDTLPRPWASFTVSNTDSCGPLNVEFTSLSESYLPIVSLEWHMGDGTIIPGNLDEVDHLYTTPGTYFAFLVATDDNGCMDTSHVQIIEIGAAPTPNFSVSQTVVCPYDPVTLTDLTAPGDSAELWNFVGDGGQLSHCSEDSVVTWGFYYEAGPQDITLEANYNSCIGSTTIPNAITVLGPIGRFIHSCNCLSPLDFTFSATTSSVDSMLWDFGDGNTLATTSNLTPNHTYAASGDYAVTLRTFNSSSGCAPFVFSDTVHARQIQAQITAPLLGCAGVGVTFAADSSVDVHGACWEGYVWDAALISDLPNYGPPKHFPASGNNIAFSDIGQYQVRLRVTDINGCIDTAYHLINVFGISADFSTDTLQGCLPFDVQFTDLSTADTTITGWQWTFDNVPADTIPSPTHTFSVANNVLTYASTLQVTDVLGCTDSKTVFVSTTLPNSGFAAQSFTNICAGDSIPFQAFEAGNQYAWDFGNGTTSSVQLPYVTYDSAGQYTVSLLATDTNGCVDSTSHTNFVTVQAIPQAVLTTSVDTIDQLCYPLLVQFTDSSIIQNANDRVWDLDISGPVVNTPTVGWLYDQPGVYNVSLEVSTTFGCRDTAYRTLNIEGPVANFTMSQALICKGESIDFNIIDTVDVFTWGWDFGDGLDTSAVDPVTHTYDFHPPGGQTLATLVYWGEDSSCAQALTMPVEIIQVVANFSIVDDDSVHCLGVQNSFIDSSLNAFSYAWNMGNGVTSDAATPPSVNYANPGTYTVMLAIDDDLTSCVDTIWKNIVVHPLPETTTIGGDSCLGDPIQLGATGGDTYAWTPPDGLSNAASANPLATPDSTTLYTVQVTDSNNCVSEDTALAFVYQPFDPVIFDTTIIIGQPLQLYANIQPGATYVWDPADSLSCSDCPNPVLAPIEDSYYVLTTTDSIACFEVESEYTITILPQAAIDVPTVFTPGVDGENALVYARGWGIKELIYFRIYNRWGELVFETTDLSEGWNGTYKGKPQNMDTYAWTLQVETFIDPQPVTKQGTITLLR